MSESQPLADPPQGPPGSAVDALLARLRAQVQEGVATRLAWQAFASVVTVGWLAVTLDRLLEPSPNTRLVIEASLGGVALGWAVFVALPRLWRPLSDRDVITLLHRQWPLESALFSTSLDLREGAGVHSSTQLNDATITAADVAARSIGDVTLLRPTSSSGLAWFATTGALAALVLGAAQPQLVSCFTSRVALADEGWPRRVRLAVQGFEWDTRRREWTRVAPRGEPTEFTVVAEVDSGEIPPATVWARGGRVGGARTLTTITRVGGPQAGETVRQPYRRRVERLDEDLAYVVRGGDASLRMRLIAGDRPQLTGLTVSATPPVYLDARPRDFGASTLQPLAEGSVVQITGGASKPLASVKATFQEAGVAAPRKLSAAFVEGKVIVELGVARSSGIVALGALDVDGLASEPIELPLEVTADSPPSVRLSLDGIARSVTRDARLPVRVRLEDDHGVRHVALVVSHGGKSTRVRVTPPPTLPGESPAVADLLTFRSADRGESIDVQPGDRLTLAAEASDRYDLSEREPAQSATITLQVVAPAELLAQIGEAQRELRQSVEALLSDVERLEYELDLQRRRGRDGAIDEQLTRWAAERRLDTRKSAEAAADAAERAGSLERQVTNNRLDQPALVDRLRRRVAQPLQEVERRHLAATDSVLEALDSIDPDPDLASALTAVRTAKNQLEGVVASLATQQNYNEVVALLRGLIREQRRVNEQTTRQESQDVRSLFD